MPPEGPDRRSPLAVGMYWAARISTIGLEMAVPPLAGFWADRRFGTQPWLTILGACFGFLAAMMDVYQLSKTKFDSRSGREKDRTSDSQ